MFRPACRLPLLVGTVLLGFALRVFCLGCESLWIDEVDSVFWATVPVGEMILDTVNHAHTPVFYLLLNAAINLTGLSEFSVRYVSVWSGLLLIPLGYWAARTLWRNPRAGYFAAFLFAISPAHINYSQETRMYALLPLLYVLMLGLVLRPRSLSSWRDWLLLAILELLALYLHLFSALMLLVINVLLLWRMIRGRDRDMIRSWILSQTAVALLFLPWLWLLWQYGSELPPNLTGSAGDASAGITEYLSLLWYFLHSGIVTNVSLVGTLTTALALFGAVALPFLFYLDTKRRALAGLLVALLLPLLMAYAVWRINPLTHPRYLFFLLAPLILLVGRLLALLSLQRGTAWLAIIGLVLLQASNGTAIAHRAEDSFDMLALASEIGRRASAADLVLMPPYDKSLWYYAPGPATARHWPLLFGDQAARASDIGSLVSGHDDVFVVQYKELFGHDPQHLLPFLLELHGALQEQFSVQRMTVDHYSLHEKWRFPELESFEAECGPFLLSGFFSEETAKPAQAAVAALRWELRHTVGQNVSVSLRLWNGEQQLAAHDSLLLDEQHLPTSEWAVEQRAISYHVLPVPLGTPPLTYSLAVQLVNEDGTVIACGDNPHGISLAELQVLPDPSQEQDAYGSWKDTEWQKPLTSHIVPGLTLEGYTIRPSALHPAQPVFVTLRWRATDELHQAYAPLLALRQGEDLLSSSAGTLFERYPTTRWQEGELLIETRELTIPATLEPLQLSLSLDEQTVPIATLAVAAESLSWQLPPDATSLCARLGEVAELAGYRWQRPQSEEDSGIVTLYWRGLAGATAGPSYTVFSHLLAPDGRLVAQHDALPASGERPTNSWLPGEIIADTHVLAVAGNDQEPLQLTTGMYELASGERVPAFDCSGQRLLNDAVPIGVLQRGGIE